MSETRIPDYIEPIVGYRAWGVMLDSFVTARSVVWPNDPSYPPVEHQNSPRLTCLGVGGVWPVGNQELTAKCRSFPLHKAPQPGCTCGLYALKTYERVIQTYQPALTGVSNTLLFVIGQVEMTGRVMVHEDGYRAERMRVVKLMSGVTRSYLVGIDAFVRQQQAAIEQLCLEHGMSRDSDFRLVVIVERQEQEVYYPQRHYRYRPEIIRREICDHEYWQVSERGVCRATSYERAFTDPRGTASYQGDSGRRTDSDLEIEELNRRYFGRP